MTEKTATEFTHRSYMRPMAGKGKELQEMLRRELGIPDGVRWFEVRFAHDDIVTVRCEYMPKEPAE